MRGQSERLFTMEELWKQLVDADVAIVAGAGDRRVGVMMEWLDHFGEGQFYNLEDDNTFGDLPLVLVQHIMVLGGPDVAARVAMLSREFRDAARPSRLWKDIATRHLIVDQGEDIALVNNLHSMRESLSTPEGGMRRHPPGSGKGLAQAMSMSEAIATITWDKSCSVCWCGDRYLVFGERYNEREPGPLLVDVWDATTCTEWYSFELDMDSDCKLSADHDSHVLYIVDDKPSVTVVDIAGRQELDPAHEYLHVRYGLASSTASEASLCRVTDLRNPSGIRLEGEATVADVHLNDGEWVEDACVGEGCVTFLVSSQHECSAIVFTTPRR
eukprot:jgi/Chlat1/3367/Chrsp23S03804